MKRRVNLEIKKLNKKLRLTLSEILAFQVVPVSSSVCHYLHAEIYGCTKLTYNPKLVSETYFVIVLFLSLALSDGIPYYAHSLGICVLF